jgi:hypothetical protein
MIHRWRRAPNVQTARRGRWIGLATPHCHANISPSLLSLESHHLNIGSLYNMHADAAISLVVRSLSFLSSRSASETKEMDGVHATMIRESNLCLVDHQPNQTSSQRHSPFILYGCLLPCSCISLISVSAGLAIICCPHFSVNRIIYTSLNEWYRTTVATCRRI